MDSEYIGQHFKSFNQMQIDNNSSAPQKSNLSACKTFGKIKFLGYEDISLNTNPQFIRFFPTDGNNFQELTYNAYELITKYWNFPKPQLLISINGGFKRMNFKNNQQKKNFKQGLMEVMRNDTTWIIGGGFHVGIHKLVSEAVNDFRILSDENENQVKLISISTWGVVKNNRSLTVGTCAYDNSNTIEKGKVTLDPNYDCYLFCDDGTEKEYDKEIDFRLDFERNVRDIGAFAVQILYEGGKRAIESIYRSLQKSIPLVVIKESGRAADLICEILETDKMNVEIVDKYEEQLRLTDDDKIRIIEILSDIYSNYKERITIHDLLDQNVHLDKKILDAIISSREDRNLEKTLNLAVRFNCVDIADFKVFQSSRASTLSQKTLGIYFKEMLSKNQHEMLQLFLVNNFSIDEFVEENLQDLYMTSLRSIKCRCTEMISDLILREDKSLKIDNINNPGKNLLKIIYKIICNLSDNILKFESFNLRSSNSHNANQNSYRELFLWSLISGYTEMALIFWENGKENVGSALIGSIILSKMKSYIKSKGFNDMSDTLLKTSIKFQELACDIITKAYKINQEKTHIVLTRPLNLWNNLTCLQIAIGGNLLDFLNLNACRSYTREAWMGDLSPFLPTWKILVTIPFSPLLIKPFIIPYVSNKKSCSNLSHEKVKDKFLFEKEKIELNIRKKSPKSWKSYHSESDQVSFCRALIKFYRAPIVKFVIYLLSYITFLVIFAYLNLVELRPIKEVKVIQNVTAELLVYIFILGFIVEEINQINNTEKNGLIYKLKSYVSGSWNLYDMLTIFIFIISIIMRFTVNGDSFIFVRCFYAVTLSLFSLRTMQFYFISRSIGPKVIMIRKMIVDVFFFLSIFSLFIISYGTLSHSIQNPNSKWNLFLISELFYRPYFQTYGELMLDDFKIPSPCNTTVCIVQSATLIIGFGIFLLMTNILLLNLLIAMFGYTFNKIQGESEKFFSFIQIQLVDEFHNKPLMPPPLNIVYYILRKLWQSGKIIFHGDSKRKNTFLIKYLNDDQNLKIRGFEHLCMESAMLENHQSTNVANINLNSDNLFDTILKNLELINEKLNNKSSDKAITSRLGVIEKHLQKMLS